MSSSPRLTYEAPLLLSLGMGGAAIVFSTCAGIFGAALLHFGTFALNSEPADPWTVIRTGWMLILPGFLAGPIAYAIRRELPWSRGAILAWWCCAALILCGWNAFNNGWQAVLEPLLKALMGFGFSYWYLFHKASVVAYFDALESRSALLQAEANRGSDG